MIEPHRPPRKTPREILVSVAGEKHELHSVAERRSPSGGVIPIKCSCGKKFEVNDTPENERALESAPKGSKGVKS